MKKIAPDVYNRDYFLSNTCEGAEEFLTCRGLSPLKERQVRHLAPGPGRRVLDVGCGRGEVLLACARAGAEVAGIDYSQAAVELSRETLEGVSGAEVVQGDATALPWLDESFDCVLIGDVVEHLVPEDADTMLREARRVLRVGGLLVVHTAPNRWFLTLTWPAARPVLRLAGHGSTVAALDHWIAWSKDFHVNEQSLYSLRRALRRAGFEAPRAWIDAAVVRDGSHHTTAALRGSWMIHLAQRLARVRPVRLLAGNDIWAVARR